jgi:hypothetical protein
MHPLALLHPRGAPAGVRRVGRCSHADELEELSVEDVVDVVVLGADAGEDALRRALAAMSPDGLVILDGPRRGRDVLRAVEALGLVAAGPPLVSRGGTIATLDTPTLKAAVRRSGSRWQLSRLAAALPPGLLARLVPCLTAWGRGTPTLAGWLESPPGGLTIACSWRGVEGSAVVTRVVGGRPAVVGKVGLGRDTQAGARELAALTLLGPAAAACGVTVPTALGAATVGGRPAAILSAVPGAPVATRPGGARPAAAAVADWLGAFTQRTLVDEPASALLVEQVLDPLAVLAPELDPAYAASVRAAVERARESRRPLAAAHGDLTLWNVLRGPDGLGVVDWEQASERSLPLLDLPYLLVDAIAVEQGSSRAAAFAACFGPGGGAAGWAAAITERVRALLGLPAESLELAGHACWLRHAADERRRGSVETPFLDVLRLHAAGTA